MASILRNAEVVLVLAITLSITSFGVLAYEQNNEITRIINQTKIHCVSELFDTPMFVSPLLHKVQDAENLVENGKWDDDDWVTSNSSNIISNVADKRWEDFNKEKGRYLHFGEFKTSASFSVFGTKQIEFLADDGELLDYFYLPINNSEEWTTFIIFFKDNNIHYFMNNKFMRKYWLKPTQVVVRTEKEVHFKIHEYKYKEASQVTNAKTNPTSLTIPPSEKSSLVFYVSLCKSCVLEVEYDGHIQNITSNIKETDIMEQWQSYKITLKSYTTNTVNFIRKMNDQKEDGYWKLDVRLYDNENNKAAFNISSSHNQPENVYYCKYLQPPNNSKHMRWRRSIDRTGYSSSIIDCPLGKVGPKCDISCENVLGHKYTQCEKHKICDSVTCLCAWGSHGDHCDQECTNRRWGLNCERTCEECQTCDKRTGMCNTYVDDKTAAFRLRSGNDISFGDLVSSWIFWSAASLLAIFLSIAILAVWRHIKPPHTPVHAEPLDL